MSNLDSDKNYSNMTDVLQFVFEQLMKNLYISIPGIINSYDPATKRAMVTPAIRIQKTDDTTMDQQPIADVPVIWPSGGGFSIMFPLVSGDPVNIFFSQRGINKFKQIYTMADPDIGIFHKEDAYIIAGFGALSITPAVSDAACFQNETGINYISIDKTGNIKIEAITNITIKAPTITLDGVVSGPGAASINASGLKIGTIEIGTHVHGGVVVGTHTTGVPQ
jgi:hypothetical protein